MLTAFPTDPRATPGPDFIVPVDFRSEATQDSSGISSNPSSDGLGNMHRLKPGLETITQALREGCALQLQAEPRWDTSSPIVEDRDRDYDSNADTDSASTGDSDGMWVN